MVTLMPGRVSSQQLGSEMPPLEHELALGFPKPAFAPREVDSRLVERVASGDRFVAYAVQVGRNGDSRISRRKETNKLWMVPVSLGAAGNDGLR